MTWENRILDASYTSPSGITLNFDYENVESEFDKKGTAFNFPEADGTYVQDMGSSGRRYKLRIFKSGSDYDLWAEMFINMLAERGSGTLTHPVYGRKTVVPHGTIARKDNLKTAANQVIFEVTFWETIGAIYPSNFGNPASDVINSIIEYNRVAAEEFEDNVEITTAISRIEAKNKHQALLDTTKGELDEVADQDKQVEKRFDNTYDSITESSDILIDDPATLASQTMLMIQTPARSLSSILNRLSSYGRLIQSIINLAGIVSPLFGSRVLANNEYAIRDLYASTYITGQVSSVINNEFLTKVDALNAATVILDAFDDLVVWRDANIEDLGIIDTGSSYQKLQESVALTAGYLVEISFTLKQEYSITLDRNRTIIDLVSELYGSLDDNLDFFINSNDLSGSEILELPTGKSVVYYI